MAAHLLCNIPALLYCTDSWSGNPSFSPRTAHSTLKQQSLCTCCPLLPDNMAGQPSVVQLVQNSLTILYGFYCYFVALLWRYVMFVFLPILLRFKHSRVRNKYCRIMYKCGVHWHSVGAVAFTRYTGTHSIRWHFLGSLALTRYTGAQTVHWHSLGSLALTRFTVTHSVHWHSSGLLAHTRYTGTHSVHWCSLGSLALTRYTGTQTVHWHSLGTLAFKRFTGTHSAQWHSLGTVALTRFIGTHSLHWHSRHAT
jgi:hypothetical protein